MNTRIIVDSTVNMSPEFYDRVTVLPLTVRFGNEEYIDGVTITNEEFYNKLEQATELPTTSQVTPVCPAPVRVQILPQRNLTIFMWWIPAMLQLVLV